MNQMNDETLFNLLRRVAERDLAIFDIAEGKAIGFWNDVEVVAALGPALDLHINGASPTPTLLRDGSVLDWDLEATYIKIGIANLYSKKDYVGDSIPDDLEI